MNRFGWMLVKDRFWESYETNRLIEEFQKQDIDIQLVNPNTIDIFVNKDFFPIKNLKTKKTKFEFSTSIGRGREVEFYNSLIFSLDVKKKNKFVNLISGGRFDELTSKYLGLKKVPAVGAAVNLSNYE